MRTIFLNSLSKWLILLLITTTDISQNQNSLIGKWKGEKETGKQSEFYLAKDGFYYGKICADAEKAENVGKIIMKKLVYDATSKTFKGTMSPPDRDLELNVTISFVTNDRIKVVAKKFVMSKTMYFTRIK